MTRNSPHRSAAWVAAMACLWLAGAAADPGAAPAAQADRITHNGVAVAFSIKPEGAAGRNELVAGGYAEVSFRVTDAASGNPLTGQPPGAWMDVGKAYGPGVREQGCKDKIGLYLKGIVGMRPMLDLNSYFIGVLNQDASISIIDPLVSLTGKTSLYATVVLRRPGADWAKSRDEKRLFVSMPKADRLALVDTERFKVEAEIDAGANPVRLAIQPDDKYLWVGNDGTKRAPGGVTVVDTATLKVAARIETGAGHHEIAFSTDERYAFVSNRDAGTVSVIDIRQLRRVKDIRTGPLPVALAFSALSQALYVSDGEDGSIAVVDGQRHEIVARIAARPGVGPLRFTPDGRWGLAANPAADAVYVIDAATNRLAHTIPVGGKPYHVAFGRAFAYVRALNSERVSLISLAELGGKGTPAVTSFAAGTVPPGKAPDLGLADPLRLAADHAAMLVVGPADNTIYYYMEGMVAPMGSFKNYGHSPRAVEIIDRSLQETEPGVYATKVKIPAAGRYDVAFLLDSPRVLHCFSVTAAENPLLERPVSALGIEYLVRDRRVTTGEALPLRFRLFDPASGAAKTGLSGVRVLYYLAPGQLRTEAPTREIGQGVYEAELSLPRSGAYYVYVAASETETRYADLPYLTLLGVAAGPVTK